MSNLDSIPVSTRQTGMRIPFWTFIPALGFLNVEQWKLPAGRGLQRSSLNASSPPPSFSLK